MKNNLKPLWKEIENHLKLVEEDDKEDVAEAIHKLLFLMREGAQEINTAATYRIDYKFKTLELTIRYL